MKVKMTYKKKFLFRTVEGTTEVECNTLEELKHILSNARLEVE